LSIFTFSLHIFFSVSSEEGQYLIVITPGKSKLWLEYRMLPSPKPLIIGGSSRCRFSAYSACKRNEKCLKDLSERDNSEDLDGDKIILERILRERGWEDVDWMNLAQDTDQWRAILYTVMKIRIP
jgi:hypothetical protein